MRALPLLLAVALLAGCLGGGDAPADDAAGDPTPGGGTQPQPAWTFTAFDGTTHAPTATGADATVLFFMATWCGVCQSKAPVLTAAYDDFADEGVRFLSIDFDPSEKRSDVESWQGRYEHPWPHGLDAARKVQRALDVTIQSTVVVLDAQGNEVERFGYGKVTESGLAAAIQRALDASAAEAQPPA